MEVTNLIHSLYFNLIMIQAETLATLLIQIANQMNELHLFIGTFPICFKLFRGQVQFLHWFGEYELTLWISLMAVHSEAAAVPAGTDGFARFVEVAIQPAFVFRFRGSIWKMFSRICYDLCSTDLNSESRCITNETKGKQKFALI